MGLPNSEYTGGALPKSPLQGVFPPRSTETFTNTSSAWENVSFESMGIHQERRHRGKPKITTQLRTHSLAPYLGCIMDIQAELRATLNNNNNNNKILQKVIVTQGQISLSRVLRIGHHASETTAIWRFDSWLQNALLLCVRIAGHNISPSVIGRDQRPGRGRVHTVYWFLGSIRHLMNHCTKKDTEKEDWPHRVTRTLSSASQPLFLAGTVVTIQHSDHINIFWRTVFI